MKTDQIQICYELSFESAFHFGTGLRRGLIHRTVGRDHDEYLYMPGSTLKGVVRDSVTQIARLFNIPASSPHSFDGAYQNFGKQGDITSLIFGSRLHPGTLFFDDASMHPDDRTFFDSNQSGKRYLQRQTDVRTQVSLSRVTRTAKQGMLFSSEYGQRELRFQGQIFGSLQGLPLLEPEEFTYSTLFLIAGLVSLDALGGGKSTGLGKVKCSIETLKINQQAVEPMLYLNALDALPYFELVVAEEAS